MEQTFVMVKPDGVQRGLVGEIIVRLERRGYRLIAAKMTRMTEELGAEHYAEHVGKPFFPSVISFMTSGPVVAMVWEGSGVIQGVRSMMGATDPAQAAPGTIRGDLALYVGMNLVHGSDSEESARREIALWFGEAEIQSYERTIDRWIHST